MSSLSSKGILWEVLAPIVRWPLRSPARFYTVVGVALVVLFAGARLSDGGGSASATEVPSATPTQSESSTPTSTPASPTSTATATSSSAAPSASATTTALPPAASTAATTFLKTWARPTLPQSQWLAAVKPLATPDLAKGLAVTDPRNIPANQVTGGLSPREVSPNFTAPTRVVFVGETNAGAMAVTVVKGKAGWLVQSIAPSDEDEG